MIVLGIETSHEHGSLGLCAQSQLVGEVLFSTELGPGERLLPALESLLALNTVTKDQLELIAVALGPGSFTSLRIGMAVGKGLAQALGLPIVGVPTMDTYAEKVSFLLGKICVVLPDRRDLVYHALYEGTTQITSERSSSIHALCEELSRATHRALCIGPGAERHRALLERVARVAPAALNQPSGALVALAGAKRYRHTQRDELWTLEPLYVHHLFASVSEVERS
jgi:tRNA threonylcarbamoyladenosine biosynthesis protein TsaB